MFRKLFKLGLVLAAAGGIVFVGLLTTDRTESVTLQKPSDAAMMSVERGELLLGLAGCVNCHTDVKNDGAVLAGGRALETPFGTFFAPNISSDTTNGIGAWSEEDFVRALRHGRRPDGANYFPAFPYAAYTRMIDGDMLAIRNAIMARPAEAEANKPHAIGFPFNQRWTMRFWKLLHFDAGVYEGDTTQSAAWNRGAYISEALAHCGECHTPRWPSGGLKRDMWLSGTANGPEGEMAPNLTQDEDTGLGTWTDPDLAFLLTDGLKIDGDVVGSVMYAVVEHGTGKLPEDDIAAIVEYLKTLGPVSNPDAPAAQGF